MPMDSSDSDGSCAVITASILIVEDDVDTRHALRVRLEHSGYEVRDSESQKSARDAIREELPDLILLDLGLPDGDGAALLARLTSDPETVAIPVIVVTANRFPATRARAFDLGASAFLEKPYCPGELLHCLEEQIDRVG